MTKTQSGLLLIAVGIAMNVVGRFVPAVSNLVGSTLFAAWMVGSLVVALFGIIRLIGGIAKRTK